MSSVPATSGNNDMWHISHPEQYGGQYSHDVLINIPEYFKPYVRGRLLQDGPKFTHDNYTFEKQLNTWNREKPNNLTRSFSCKVCQKTKNLWMSTVRHLDPSFKTTGYTTEYLCQNDLLKMYANGSDPSTALESLLKSHWISFSTDEHGISPVETTWNKPESEEGQAIFGPNGVL
jgi:hypothetical protein